MSNSYAVIFNSVFCGQAADILEAQNILLDDDIILVNGCVNDFLTNDQIIPKGCDPKFFFVKVESDDFRKTDLYHKLNQVCLDSNSFTSLEERKSNEDFAEISVWNFKKALIEAYHLGQNSNK